MIQTDGISVTGNVTLDWLAEQKLYNEEAGQIGVPVDINDLSKGLSWKDIANLKDNDFDILEEFHSMKTK
jgi:hypothetical protein